MLCVTFLYLTGCTGERDAVRHEKALFVSVVENDVLSDTAGIRRLVMFSKAHHIRTLFIQVYRANKAWFACSAADASPYEAAKKSVGEDPLAMLIRQSHREGLEVHAWLNLLSLSANEDAPLLKKYGPDILTRNLEPKGELQDYQIDNQYFLEPGDPRVGDALAAVVGDLVRAYPDLDGIQMDYIRYPDWHPAYGRTAENERRFKVSRGVPDIDASGDVWAVWQCEQVTALVRRLAGVARSINPALQVSTTALAPYSRAKLESKQDWKAWVDSGLVDFVTLMAYTPSAEVFRGYLKDAKAQLGGLKKMNIAVAAYALGDSPETFTQEWGDCERSGARACVAFHYSSLIEHPALSDPLQ